MWLRGDIPRGSMRTFSFSLLPLFFLSWFWIVELDTDVICGCRYDVAFVGMVRPGDELSVKIKHIAMCDGNRVVKVGLYWSSG